MQTRSKLLVLAMLVIVGAAVGCVHDYKPEIAEYTSAISDTTETTSALVDKCKAGDQAACDEAKANLAAIDKSSIELQQKAK